MPTKLPHRILNARCERVVSPNCLDLRLGLGFGLELRRNVLVEGVDVRLVAASQREGAKHCAVILVGGRDLLVQADDTVAEGGMRARAYLDVVAPELSFAYSFPDGMDRQYPELAALFRWVAEQGFDPAATRHLMRSVRG